MLSTVILFGAVVWLEVLKAEVLTPQTLISLQFRPSTTSPLRITAAPVPPHDLLRRDVHTCAYVSGDPSLLYP